jgi:Domain of unknown function (DUF222)
MSITTEHPDLQSHSLSSRALAVPESAPAGPPPSLPPGFGPSSPSSLPIERLEAELIGCAALENVHKARFVGLLAEFLDRRGWESWACVSPVQWLSWKCGLGPTAASVHIRVARALGALPAIAAAFASGALSWSKVRAVTRVATPATDSIWAEWARHGTGAQIDTMAAAARRMGAADVDRQEATRSFTWRTDGDGSVVFSWRVPAETGAAVIAAVNQHTTPERDVPIAQTRSDSLAALVFGPDPVTPEVVIHVDQSAPPPRPGDGSPIGRSGATGSARSADGVVVPSELVEVGICSGTFTVVVHDPDGAVRVSDRIRNPTPRTRRALRARDRQCRMPGCHHQGGLQAHHIDHYNAGGSRRLTNLVRLCAAHHRLVHRHGLQLAWSPEGELLVAWPDGSATDRPVANTTPPELLPHCTPAAPWEGHPLDLDGVVIALTSRLPATLESGGDPSRGKVHPRRAETV